MSKCISLVLSAGGARGYAHIGAIQVLEERGFSIQAIAGSSMGALVGGLHALGALEEYREWVLTLDFFDVLRLVDFSFSEAGMIKGDRVFEKMSYLFGDTLMEDLSIPLTVVATDLHRSKEVWLRRGSLKQAVRASIAIPMVLTPATLDGRVLVDGGVLNPLPVAATVLDQTDLVIAVDVNASHGTQPPVPPPPAPTVEQDRQAAFQAGINAFLSNVGWFSRRREEEETPDLGMFQVMNRMLETMQQSMTRYKIAGYSPDILIQVPATTYNIYDFHKAYDLIELGRQETAAALDDAQEKGLI